MKPDRSSTGSRRVRRGRLAGLGALSAMTLALAACGGDDSSSVGASSLAQATASQQASAQAAGTQAPAANQPYVDPVAYSM
ncbi:peptidase S10, partial [Burkholderia cenocepacia]